MLPLSLSLFCFTSPVVCRYLTRSLNQILIDGQPVQADGTSAVDLVCADPDLGAESVSHPVGHAGARIPIYTGGVYSGEKSMCNEGRGG